MVSSIVGMAMTQFGQLIDPLSTMVKHILIDSSLWDSFGFIPKENICLIYYGQDGNQTHVYLSTSYSFYRSISADKQLVAATFLSPQIVLDMEMSNGHFEKTCILSGFFE